MSAKNSTTAAAEVAPEVAAKPDQITLIEFCTRISATVRRPELISGFEYTERMKGNVKADASAFQAAFDKFRNTPV